MTCKACNGVGKRTYPNTATFRIKPGMIVGHAMRTDTCDKCWGSGDSDNPGENLLQKEEERVK